MLDNIANLKQWIIQLKVNISFAQKGSYLICILHVKVHIIYSLGSCKMKVLQREKGIALTMYLQDCTDAIMDNTNSTPDINIPWHFHLFYKQDTSKALLRKNSIYPNLRHWGYIISCVSLGFPL